MEVRKYFSISIEVLDNFLLYFETIFWVLLTFYPIRTLRLKKIDKIVEPCGGPNAAQLQIRC